MRRRGLEMPILLMLRRKRLEDVPVEVLNHTDGTIFLSEETPEFVALNLASRLRNYAATLKTPFFEAEHLPELVMSPQDASQLLTRNRVDYLPISEISGRVAATLMLVYPPGIAIMVPGERVGRNSSPMIDYLLAFERLENAFPGLSTEIQGVYREKQPDGGVRFYTYVLSDG